MLVKLKDFRVIEFVRDIYRAFMGNFIRSNNDISKIIKIKTVSILLDELIIPVSESVSKFLSDIRTRNIQRAIMVQTLITILLHNENFISGKGGIRRILVYKMLEHFHVSDREEGSFRLKHHPDGEGLSFN